MELLRKRSIPHPNIQPKEDGFPEADLFSNMSCGHLTEIVPLHGPENLYDDPDTSQQFLLTQYLTKIICLHIISELSLILHSRFPRRDLLI